MTPSPSQLSRGYAVALSASVLLSTTAIFIRHLTQVYALPPLVLAFWRDLLVAAAAMLALRVLRPKRLRVQSPELRYLLAYGLLLAFFNASWTWAVALNGAAVATVLAYSSAGFTALLGWWFLREKLDRVKLTAVALSFGGCVLVSGVLNQAEWQVNLLGILTGVLSGLAYAIYSLMGRSAAQRGLSPWTTLLYTFAFAAGFLFLFNLLPADFSPGAGSQASSLLWLGSSWGGWLILFLLAVGPTLAGFGLYNVSLSLLPSSIANIILTSEPVFTAIIAYVLLGERLNGTQISGGIMILAGVVFLRLHNSE